MKTQRRHELQTNYLADWLGKQLEAIKPYSKAILGVAIALLAAWVAVTVISNRQASELGQSWSAYFGAMSDAEPDEALSKVAKEYGGTTAGLWALQSAADNQFAQASMEMFRDPKSARESLKRAKENYGAVEKVAAREPMLWQRAVYGLAQVHESLGELNEARAKYEELAKQAPDTAIGKVASRRLAQLVDASGKLRPDIEKFYDELAVYEPPLPAVIPRDSSSTFGEEFQNPAFDLNSLPDRPDLSFPGSEATPPPASTGPADPEKTETAPSPDQDKPAADEPAVPPPVTPPAPEQPDDKPAAEPPAPEKPADEN